MLALHSRLQRQSSNACEKGIMLSRTFAPTPQSFSLIARIRLVDAVLFKLNIPFSSDAFERIQSFKKDVFRRWVYVETHPCCRCYRTLPCDGLGSKTCSGLGKRTGRGLLWCGTLFCESTCSSESAACLLPGSTACLLSSSTLWLCSCPSFGAGSLGV
jgi:hypothetical protein